MYTNQVQSLTAALSRIARPQEVQAIVQSLANCAQPLTTRGPLNVNGAASSSQPRGGVFTAPPNYGGITRGSPTGNAVQDWSNGAYEQAWPRMGGDIWNQQFFNQLVDNGFYAGDNNYWGGDTFYGDNYLTNNNVYNNQSFLNNILQNYNYSENYYNQVNNNTFAENYNNWYTQQFVDNSYTDFSTQNNFTTNQYNQTVNNHAGDNYFDNTYTNNNTYNNNVTNYGDTIHEGDVYNNANTYLTENKTFVTNNNTTEEFNTYVTNLVGGNVISVPTYRAVIGAVGVPDGAISGGKVTLDIPSDACSGGTVEVTLTPTTAVVKSITAATLDPDECTISLESSDVTVVTGVTAQATFAPNKAATAPVVATVAGNKAADRQVFVVQAIQQAGRIPVLGPL